MKTWKSLLGFGAAVAGAALVGVAAQKQARGWYRTLDKPAFNPPDWVFGPVWTALYAMMALSAHRVWKQPPSPERSRALGLWGAQLAANAAWTPLFFGAHKPAWALADLVALLAGIAAYTHQAAKVDKPAAWLMAPYAAWSTFATVLNEEIVRLN